MEDREKINGTTIQHRFVDLGEVTLHCVEAGTGPLVVLLHGFPDHWYSWRQQLPALVAAGFRVVAPDMRGYNLSDKPQGLSAYRAERLAADVRALIRASGEQRARVVGHDWGGLVAWQVAALFPECLERIVVMNAPHPLRFLRTVLTSRQILRSTYALAFQFPWLPEATLSAARFFLIRRSLRALTVRKGAFSDDDLDRYLQALAQPGALTSALNYYRASLRRRPGQQRRFLRRIAVPTMIIWGEQDPFLERNLAEPGRWAPTARVERLVDAGHWVHLDQPKRVNELLVDFLQSARASSAGARKASEEPPVEPPQAQTGGELSLPSLDG